MPIYEYQCGACGKLNEVMQKIGADAPEACDACAKGPLTKLLSKTAFILKGTGWYETDFKGSGSKPAVAAPAKTDGGSSEPAAPASDSSKTETKSESKPAASGGATACGHKH